MAPLPVVHTQRDAAVSALVAAVGEASRRRIEDLAPDVPGFGLQNPSLEQGGEREHDDVVTRLVRVHGMRGGDTGRDPRRAQLAFAWCDADEAVRDEDGVVAAEREIPDAVGGVEEGTAVPGERAGGDDDVRLQAGRVLSDEVQLAGRRVVLRVRSERALLACEVDTTERVDPRSQLVGGRFVAEREHRAAEGDEVVNI